SSTLLKDGSYTDFIANTYNQQQTISIESAAIYRETQSASGIINVDTGVCIINPRGINGTILKPGDTGYIAVSGFKQNFIYQSLEDAFYGKSNAGNGEGPISSTFYFPAGNYTAADGGLYPGGAGQGSASRRYYAPPQMT
ncbi:MAG: hypothetical protein RR387_05630, partial [Clostridiales bacterium]